MTFESFTEQLQLLPGYLSGHMLLVLISLTVGIIICVPIGLLVTRVKALQWPVLTLASILQTIPGIALLALMVPLLGTIGFLPALLALILYSVLPILRNTVTGIIGVEPSLIEAGRGIGMSDWQLLRQVEIPLALPTIVAGIRTAAVWVVGTATLATPVGGTSLGNYVFAGLQTQNVAAILTGCFFAALLAIIIDQLIRLVEMSIVKRSRLLGIISVVALVILIVGALSPRIIQAFNQKENAVKIVIGSKPFTEQYILAEFLSDRLIEAGYQTDLRSGMGSMILFEALTNNSVDLYIDYSGTLWTNVLKRTDQPNRKQMLVELSQSLKENYNVTCLGSLGFENSYALALPGEMARREGLNSIDDLAVIARNLKMGSDYEFFSRPEWLALKNSYALEFKELISMDPTLMYSAVTQNEVDVISAYSTDGRIAAFDLTVLTDSKQALPPYDAVIMLSPQASSDPLLLAALKPLLGSINNQAMQQANKLVDLDKVSVDSAAAFLSTRLNDISTKTKE